MNNRIVEKTEPDQAHEHGAARAEVPNPLDSWLRRELKSLYSGAGSDELPPELAELASRLEEKLTTAQDEGPHEEGPGPDRESRSADRQG